MTAGMVAATAGGLGWPMAGQSGGNPVAAAELARAAERVLEAHRALLGGVRERCTEAAAELSRARGVDWSGDGAEAFRDAVARATLAAHEVEHDWSRLLRHMSQAHDGLRVDLAGAVS